MKMNTNPPVAASVAPIALSIPQAVAATSLSRPNIYRSIKDGSLRTLKVGRRRLILPADLSAWLAARSTAA